jgi:hypothetical protein
MKDDIGYLAVADVTQDPDEPDVSAYEESGIPELDRFLEREMLNHMARDGREMIRWTSARFVKNRLGKVLLTTYSAKDRGIERQYIEMRIRVGQRNVVVAGCYTANRADSLAECIISALNDARPLI